MIKDKKKVYIFTMGCQMNEYDTELVRSILHKNGYSFVPDENQADIVMLNTCAIREHAHRKVYGRIHEIRHKIKSRKKEDGRWKKGKEREPIIGILGCMATNLRRDLLENRNLNIDFIAGPDSYKRLPNLIDECLKEGRGNKEDGSKHFDVTLSEYETYSDVYPQREKGVNAWIAVMRGCNNFCSFCVVPYTRGRERSRSIANIVEEVNRLVDEGFKQVTLLGQNVNSYYHDNHDFADLLHEVSKVNGIYRIRFTSPHPKDFPDKLLNVIAQNGKVCKHIHFPLQAGNNRILDLMNRTYTKEEYLQGIDKMRALIPNIAISTDIIVGFSSETDEEFAETVEVMETVRFDSAFIFKYSERKNTIAAKKHPDHVPEAIKTERIVSLNELQQNISWEQNMRHIGTTQEVLVEKTSLAGKDDVIQARTDGNHRVIMPDQGFRKGDILDCLIADATPHVLKGARKVVVF